MHYEHDKILHALHLSPYYIQLWPMLKKVKMFLRLFKIKVKGKIIFKTKQIIFKKTKLKTSTLSTLQNYNNGTMMIFTYNWIT